MNVLETIAQATAAEPRLEIRFGQVPDLRSMAIRVSCHDVGPENKKVFKDMVVTRRELEIARGPGLAESIVADVLQRCIKATMAKVRKLEGDEKTA